MVAGRGYCETRDGRERLGRDECAMFSLRAGGGFFSLPFFVSSCRMSGRISSTTYRRTLREMECGSLTGSSEGYRWWLIVYYYCIVL